MAADLVRSASRSLYRRHDRALAHMLADAQLPAQIAAAKIEGAAFATHTALQHAAMLSSAEARLLQQAPLGDNRYRAIVDSFAGYACHELSLLVHR
jgi:hypothetical protein